MKRIYFALVFLFIGLLIGAVELGFITGRVDVYDSKINKCDKLMLNYEYDEARKICSDIVDEWDEDSRLIDIALNHDYVDSISVRLAKMKTYTENRNQDMYFSESAAAKKELASIKDSEFISVENIL